MEVLFGTPSYAKTLSVDYTTSAVQTAMDLASRGIGMRQRIIAGNCFIDAVRNQIVDYFLDETQADHLLFIDSDVGWDYQVIPRLLAYPQEVVAGLVPKRDTDNEASFHQNALTGVTQNGLFQALEAPTAFMRIARSAFAKLKKPYFRTGSCAADFGEDIYFCRRWVEAGEFIWIDSDISFSHRGDRVWKGNFYDHAVQTGLLRSDS